MKSKLATIAVGMLAAGALAVGTSGHFNYYGSARTLNEGWLLDLPAGQYVGYETRGAPGFFYQATGD